MFGNPYTPGAGCIPPYLAGRESLINNAESSLQRLKEGYPQRSFMYYGLRGVGKTVLLNAIESAAENLEISYTHIEASEDNLFLSRLIMALNRFIRQVSVTESVKTIRDKCLKLISSFAVVYDLKDSKVLLELSPDEIMSTGILDDDLTEIFVLLGRCAAKSNKAICIFVDEFQYVTLEQAKALITSLHRCNQLRLPVMLFCAGLPKAIQIASDACSYSERIFVYERIGKLAFAETRAAIEEPAMSLSVKYEKEAIDRIARVTEGYPYFVQEYCSVIWENIDECKVVTIDAVESIEGKFFESLDRGFFEARIIRCTGFEKKFMLAMAECETMPCNINDVAKRLGRDARQISPVRGKLIDKGMIYSPARGEIDFTVPLFGDYLLRTHHII